MREEMIDQLFVVVGMKCGYWSGVAYRQILEWSYT